jgi:hypothetical protein
MLLQPDRRPDRVPAWWRVPAGLAVGAGIVLVLAQTGAGRFVMRETGLETPLTSYTALSFTDPNALPLEGHLPLGHVSVDVGFALRNASQATGRYQWTIRLVDGNRVTPVATGRATVQAGGTVDESRIGTGMCLSGRLKVVVSLASPVESIDLMESCSG